MVQLVKGHRYVMRNNKVRFGQSSLRFEFLEPRQMMVAKDVFDLPPIAPLGNDTAATATLLGKGPLITLNVQTVPLAPTGAEGLTIFPAQESDFFEVTAQSTGKMVIETRSGAGTDVDMHVFNPAASPSIHDNTESGTLGRLKIPVVAGQTYFIQTVGFTPVVVFPYELQIETVPAPVPDAPTLAPDVPGGTSNPSVRHNAQPSVLVNVDLKTFVDIEGSAARDQIDTLTAAQANAGTTAGVAVRLRFINTATGVVPPGGVGFADDVSVAKTRTQYQFSPSQKLPDGLYAVTAEVVVVDNRAVIHAVGATAISAPLLVQITHANNLHFVEQLYRDILHREADGPGAASWEAQLTANVLARDQVVSFFLTSTERRGVLVDQYYRVFLEREADSDGRTFWVNQFTVGGLSEEQVIQFFLTSSEYNDLHPSDESFVIALYQDMLGRTPSSAEVPLWTGVPRATAALAFAASTERHNFLVREYYNEFLDREPDGAGKAFFTNKLDSNPTPVFLERDLGLAITASEEYLSRF